MELTLQIPDDIAACLAGSGGLLSRTALEALAIEGYRGGALTTKQVRLLPFVGLQGYREMVCCRP